MSDVQKRHVFNLQSRMIFDIRGNINICAANIANKLCAGARADCDGFHCGLCEFVYKLDFVQRIGRFHRGDEFFQRQLKRQLAGFYIVVDFFNSG